VSDSLMESVDIRSSLRYMTAVETAQNLRWLLCEGVGQKKTDFLQFCCAHPVEYNVSIVK